MYKQFGKALILTNWTAMKHRDDLSLQQKYELIVETAMHTDFRIFFLGWEKYVLEHPDEYGLPPNNQLLNRTVRLHLVIKKWEEEGEC